MAKLEDLFTSYKMVSPPSSATLDNSATGEEESQPAAPDVGVFLRPENLRRASEVMTNYVSRKDAGDNSNLEEPEEVETLSSSSSSGIDWATGQPYNYFADPETYRDEYRVRPSSQHIIEEFAVTGICKKYNRGNLAEEIKQLFKDTGIKAKITSAKRNPGTAGNAGSRSHHVYGNAVDIIPTGDETFETLKRKLLTNPKAVQFFYENGLGILDETDSNTMALTGATGKHFHIGPDRKARNTWLKWTNLYENYGLDNRENWTKTIYSAYKKALKDKYGSQYDDRKYSQIAKYMTQQSAVESGWGQKTEASFNYGGHKKNNQTVNYSSLDAFIQAHMKTLSKWDIMKANNLREYVDSLYEGKFLYNAHQNADKYYESIAGVTSVDDYIKGLEHGGRIEQILKLHEQGFS